MRCGNEWNISRNITFVNLFDVSSETSLKILRLWMNECLYLYECMYVYIYVYISSLLSIEWMNEFSQTSLKGQGLLLRTGHSSCVLYSWASPIELKFFKFFPQHTVYRTSGPLVARKSFELVSPFRPLSPHVPSAFSGVSHGELVCPSIYSSLNIYLQHHWSGY